ncbi:MAG TPA: hypothetical protein VEQ58_23205 [Polyangiaceae bacterium]|nr:hypothetical protein [Polyangiaceae bacterium]
MTSRVRRLFAIPTLGSLLLVVACGSEDPSKDDGAGGSGDGPTMTGPLIPWAVGYNWTYRVTDDDEVSTKVNTIGDLEPVGGDGPNAEQMAYKVTTTKKSSTDHTDSWQAPVGDKVLRYRELSYSASSGELELEEYWDPYKLHIDWSAEHLVEGASWLEEYEETKLPVGDTESHSTRRDRWTVRSLSESVTVPAGTFDAVVFQKVGADSLKNYWYVPGVGKVKETGGQTEELMAYELKP